MKVELKFFPHNVEQDIVSLFQVCNPDIKVTNTTPSTIEKILKRSMRKNDSLLTGFRFSVFVECSVCCYMSIKDNIPGCNAMRRVYNMSIDTGENMTFYIPSVFNDKDRILFHSHIEKTKHIIDHFKNKDLDIYDMLHVLPMSVNINFLLSLSIHDIYIMMAALNNNKKNMAIEYDQMVRAIFETMCDVNSNIFNQTLLEFCKASKE